MDQQLLWYRERQNRATPPPTDTKGFDVKLQFLKTALVAAACAFGGIAGAAPIAYEGSIVYGQTVNGSVDGSDCGICGLNGIAGLDFWRFFATAGDVITIRGERTDINLDLSFTLYQGLTGADTSTTNGHVFWQDGVSNLAFGGMLGLAFRDDEIPHPGPHGDPLLNGFAITTTGDYTIVVGAASGFGRPNTDYSLTLNGNTGANVPEPGTLALLGLGIAGFGAARRKKA
jgi:hypothetical protein